MSDLGPEWQPVTWTEKGRGLVIKLRESGAEVRRFNNVFRSRDPVTAQATIDGYTLAEAQEYAKQQAREFANTQRADTSDISALDLINRYESVREAREHNDNPQAITPILDRFAVQTGFNLNQVKTYVINNWQPVIVREVDVSARLKLHEDAIDALTTFAEVSAYDYTTGYPA